MATQIFYHDTIAASPGAINFYHDRMTASAGAVKFMHDTTMSRTAWTDINTDIRCALRVLSDINCDIRCVSIRTVIRDMNCDVRCAERMLYDMNTDIRCILAYPEFYDMNTDIRSAARQFYDMNCDIRCVTSDTINGLSDISTDIRCLSRQLYDMNCDIRCNPAVTFYDMACDIRCRKAEAAGIDSIRVKLNGNYLTDLDGTTLNFNTTSDENPGQASFRLGRYSDDFNRTLAAVASPLVNEQVIQIYFDGKLMWYGYLIGVEPTLNSEQVIVTCVDRKYKVQDDIISLSYGREGDYENTGVAIKYVLDSLVSDGLIASYTGLPTGIVPELAQVDGVPRGTLLTELLDVSGNYAWNIDVNSILHIYKSGNTTAKTLPMQRTGYPVNLYDVIDYNSVVNDKSNIITTLEVVMGTESDESYASYKRSSLQDVQLTPDWSQGLEDDYWADIVTNMNLVAAGMYSGNLNTVDIRYRNIFRKFRVPGWTEGSSLDPTIPLIITVPSYVGSIKEDWYGNDRVYTINYSLEWNSRVAASFNASDGTVMLPTASVTILRERWATGRATLEEILSWRVHKPRITCSYFKKEEIALAADPTIFDVTWVGNGGAGKTRRAVFSSLGIREYISWKDYEDGVLVPKEELGFDDTAYATDRAKLMLSRTNDLNTSGNILLTIDAFKYYDIGISDRINMSQTKYTDIYKDNNGFPLDVVGYSFDGSTYQITLAVAHVRSYVATKNFRG